MASTCQPLNPQPAGRQSFGTRMNQLWQRVTDGLELNQLWNQFRTDLAEYEPATHALTCINAGHNWPMLRRNTGLIERLDAGGLPLGIKPDAIYETETATLETGDWLVVFTDGVVEAPRRSEIIRDYL